MLESNPSPLPLVFLWLSWLERMTYPPYQNAEKALTEYCSKVKSEIRDLVRSPERGF
jgi:hypothetical protein